MGTQTITTKYDWEAERIADEMRHSAVAVEVKGHELMVSGLKWTLEPRHVRAICDVLQVQHAWLDGVVVV